MSRRLRLPPRLAPTSFACASALLVALGTPGVTVAQTDPAAQQMIDRLRIQPGQTRGLRLPPQETPGAAPSEPTPQATPGPPVSATVRPPPPPPRETTAPSGVSAVSITVTFATGSAELSPVAQAALAPLGRALLSADLAPYRFRIEGHTDTVGASDMNLLLSQRRAEAVRDWLVKTFGVSPARLDAIGLGETQLLMPTGDQVPQVRNRRVQVLNLGS